MEVETKSKVFLPLIGAFVLVAMYFTWEWDFFQIMLVLVGVFFLISPLLKMETINRICERIGGAFF